MRPIEDIRAVNYTWMEVHPTDDKQVIERYNFRIEIRRQGSDKWEEIPVIERPGDRPQSQKP